jgi:hypothetical protein
MKRARSPSKKQQLVGQICTELTVHAKVEEEIFYPAVKQALKDKELVPEATVEHATLKALIAQVEGVEPEGEMFEAKMQVLSEYVKHHVKEEQDEMFPKAKATSLDMKDLGAEIAARKEVLLAERTKRASRWLEGVPLTEIRRTSCLGSVRGKYGELSSLLPQMLLN